MNETYWPTWRAGDAEISVRPPDVCFSGFGLYASSGGENLGFAQFLASKPARAALDRFMGRRIGRQVIAAVEKHKPGTWQNGAYSVEVRLAEVCVGTNDPRAEPARPGPPPTSSPAPTTPSSATPSARKRFGRSGRDCKAVDNNETTQTETDRLRHSHAYPALICSRQLVSNSKWAGFFTAGDIINNCYND